MYVSSFSTSEQSVLLCKLGERKWNPGCFSRSWTIAVTSLPISSRWRDIVSFSTWYCLDVASDGGIKHLIKQQFINYNFIGYSNSEQVTLLTGKYILKKSECVATCERYIHQRKLPIACSAAISTSDCSQLQQAPQTRGRRFYMFIWDSIYTRKTYKDSKIANKLMFVRT